MTPEQHAFWARRLIDAVGGPTLGAAICRVSAPQLSRYCDARYDQIMPADVMAVLQAECRNPIYSNAISEITPKAEPGDIREDACEPVSKGAAILDAVRLALKHSSLTPNDRAELHKLVAADREALDQLDRDIDASPNAGAGNVRPIR